jgi:hypothetical protein
MVGLPQVEQYSNEGVISNYILSDLDFDGLRDNIHLKPRGNSLSL